MNDKLQGEREAVMPGTWSLKENVKALLSNPEAAINGFGYEWLTTVIGALAAQAEDAERFRWLITNNAHIDRVGAKYRITMHHRNWWQMEFYETPREAIDAAKREGDGHSQRGTMPPPPDPYQGWTDDDDTSNLMGAEG